MPFKSKAQRRLFYAKAGRGEIPMSTVKTWERHTGGRRLPERVKTASINRGFLDELVKLGLIEDPAREEYERKLRQFAAQKGGGISFREKETGTVHKTPATMPMATLQQAAKKAPRVKKVVPGKPVPFTKTPWYKPTPAAVVGLGALGAGALIGSQLTKASESQPMKETILAGFLDELEKIGARGPWFQYRGVNIPGGKAWWELSYPEKQALLKGATKPSKKPPAQSPKPAAQEEQKVAAFLVELEKIGVVKGTLKEKIKGGRTRTIPKEVKSLADRIRKKQPGKGDEYAYRTAWDIYSSYVSKRKKSPVSGLRVAGGKTGHPLSTSR